MSTTQIEAATALIRADQQIAEVRPALERLIKDPFGPKTRAAQNMTLLLSGLGIAVVLGFITLEEFGGGESKLKFQASALSLGFLLLCTSTFVLIRFLLFSHENLAVQRLERLAAYQQLLEASLPFMKISAESDERKKGLFAEAVEKRMSIEHVVEQARAIALETEARIQPYLPLIRYIDTVQNAGKWIDRFRSVVDRLFPTALWLALVLLLAQQAGYRVP
jgi:hypothetical protein